MKLASIFLIISLIVITITCSDDDDPVKVQDNFDPDELKSELSQMFNNMLKSFETGDLDLAKSLISENWEIYTCQMGIITKEPWIGFFEGTFKPGGNVKIVSKDLKWCISNDMVMHTSEAFWDFKDGLLPDGNFIATFVYEKIDGNWKIVHIHQSPFEN